MAFEAIDGGHGEPQEPDWSSIFTDDLELKAASDHWREIVREMRDAGTLVIANGHAIRRCVIFRIECDRSIRNVAEEGKIIRAKRTKRPQINPEWTCLKQAAEALTILEAELGLSPRRRAAAGKVQRARKKATAADGYLKPIAK